MKLLRTFAYDLVVVVIGAVLIILALFLVGAALGVVGAGYHATCGAC